MRKEITERCRVYLTNDFLAIALFLGMLAMVGLFVDHAYGVFKESECKKVAIEHNLPYLEVKELCTL